MADKSKSKNTVLAAVSYFLGVFAVLVYLLVKDDKYVRFHSLQAALYAVGVLAVFIGMFIVSFALAFVPSIGGLLSLLVGIINFLIFIGLVLYWLYLVYKAFSGEQYKAFLIGGFAEKSA